MNVNITPYAIPGVIIINARSIAPNLCKHIFTKEFNHVCEVMEQDPEEVAADNSYRKREYVVIRQICMALFNRKYRVSLAKAAAYFNKDHATALHAIKTQRNLRATDKYYKKKTDPLFEGVNLNDEASNYRNTKPHKVTV